MSRRRRGNRVRLADLSPEAQEQARAQLAEQDRAPRPEARQVEGPPDPLAGASGLERRYALHLQDEQVAGRVLWWRYEPIRLVLRGGKKGAKGLTYTPDFLAVISSCAACSGTGTVHSFNAQGSLALVSTCGICEGTRSSGAPRLELHEVKPTKSGEVFWMGDSRGKVLAAAELFRAVPWRLVLVWPAPGGWAREVL